MPFSHHLYHFLSSGQSMLPVFETFLISELTSTREPSVTLLPSSKALHSSGSGKQVLRYVMQRSK